MLDVDGTITLKDGTVDPRLIKKLCDLAEGGVHIIFATGRDSGVLKMTLPVILANKPSAEALGLFEHYMFNGAACARIQ